MKTRGFGLLCKIMQINGKSTRKMEQRVNGAEEKRTRAGTCIRF